MTVRLVNLTPHAVVLVGEDGRQIAVPPSGTVARCREDAVGAGTFDVDGVTVPAVRKVFGEIEGLPDPAPGTVYIVSALAAQAAWRRGRRDVVVPGDPVRDDQGRIVGARSLCVAP